MVKSFIRVSRKRSSDNDNVPSDDDKKPTINSIDDEFNAYLPPSSSDDEKVITKKKPKSPSKSTKKAKISKEKSKKTSPMWKTVPSNVILCGQKSLHCQNPGNIIFKDYIKSAVVLSLKNRLDKRFKRTKLVDEIFQS